MSTVITNSSHGPGRTCLAFSRDGSTAYTGGSDCIVRVWSTALGASQEPDAASEAEDAITSIATTNNCWLSGSSDGRVLRYTGRKADFAGIFASTANLPVESVSIDPKGTKAAITSRDFSVRLIELEDTSKIHLLNGHTQGVRSASWHPSGSLLTTCGSDGNIMAWDVSKNEPILEKTIEGIIPAATHGQPEYVHDCSVLWHPSGHHFFVASLNHEIVSVPRDTWSKSSALADDSITGVVTALAISRNGLYLASATNADVFIWSTQTKRVLFRQSGTSTSTITQLAFSPTQNLLAWTDTDGIFSRWLKPISDNFPDPVKSSSSGGSSDQKAFLFPPDLVPAREDDDDAGMVDLDDDWIIDDTDGQIFDEEPVANVKEMVSITKAQSPFQPGCTPMENKKRYLAYNMIGLIEVTDQDTHHIVNVEFHNHSARKGYHFTDHFKYDLGSLGERGAIFACQPENEQPAQVLYKPYEAWTSHSEWTYRMRRGTRVIGVAASGVSGHKSLRPTSDDLLGFGNVIVATSESDLTFLSGTGRERRIVGLGAEYVSMVAGPEWAFVVHRAGSTTIDGSQNLSFSLFNYQDFSVRQAGLLPLSKGHTLKWIGITNEGAPAIYDTAGFVHILTNLRFPMAATWARIMDTNLLERREGKDESYWPVGVAGSTFMCLILKGRQQYPGFPKPLIQELPIRLPFRRGVEDLIHEELVERELMLLQFQRDELGDRLITDDISKREMTIDKEIIKLIQIACKQDNIPRAIEATKLLHHTASFDMAVKVADFYHLVGLREKIETLKAGRTERRLVTAREGYKQWEKSYSPPPMDPITIANSLDDFSKPPAISRPGLARATPHVENTRYSTSLAAESPSLTPQLTTDPLPTVSEPSGKRKRNESEESAIDDDLKRRTFGKIGLSTPKLECTNPFARKPANKNPFSRKIEPNKISRNNERLLDKMDGTGLENLRVKGGTGKEREKEATKQMTLFGLLGPASDKAGHNTQRTSDTTSPDTTQSVDLPQSSASTTLVGSSRELDGGQIPSD